MRVLVSKTFSYVVLMKIIAEEMSKLHNSEEDARACIELLKRKVAAGFGEFKNVTEVESVFERLLQRQNQRQR